MSDESTGRVITADELKSREMLIAELQVMRQAMANALEDNEHLREELRKLWTNAK